MIDATNDDLLKRAVDSRIQLIQAEQAKQEEAKTVEEMVRQAKEQYAKAQAELAKSPGLKVDTPAESLPMGVPAAYWLDLRGYDLVVPLSHCVAKGAGAGQGVRSIAYTFTPMRYIWDQAPLYFNRDRFPAPVLWLIRAALRRLRRWDTRVHPDRYIAISDRVAARIRDCYGRESSVIRPPVDLAKFPEPSGRPDEGFYLMVTALAPYKRIADAVEACRLLGRKLVIVGSGEDEARLRAAAGPHVSFRGWLEDGEVAGLYGRARGFLLPGEEDFGIAPLESMACGRPVVALGRGGALETVVDVDAAGPDRPPTGILYGEPGARPLADAIARLEREAGSFDPRALRRHAAAFDRPRFLSEVRSALEEFAAAVPAAARTASEG